MVSRSRVARHILSDLRREKPKPLPRTPRQASLATRSRGTSAQPHERGPQNHRTVDRVTRILEEVVYSPGLTFAELVRAVGAPKSSVHGFIRGLLVRGWLHQERHRFYLGPAVYGLTLASGHIRAGLVTQQIPRRAPRGTGSPAYLGVQAGDHPIYVAEVAAIRSNVSTRGRTSVARSWRQPEARRCWPNAAMRSASPICAVAPQTKRSWWTGSSTNTRRSGRHESRPTFAAAERDSRSRRPFQSGQRTGGVRDTRWSNGASATSPEEAEPDSLPPRGHVVATGDGAPRSDLIHRSPGLSPPAVAGAPITPASRNSASSARPKPQSSRKTASVCSPRAGAGVTGRKLEPS